MAMHFDKFLDKNRKISAIKIKQLTDEELNQLTEKFPSAKTVVEMIYLGLRTLDGPPTCDLCTKPAAFKSSVAGYSKWCGGNCATKASSKRGKDSHLSDPTIREKIKKTNIKRYGSENANQSELVKQKTRNTCRVKYGTNSWLASDAAKQLSSQRISDPLVRKKASTTLVKNWLIRRLNEISSVATPLFNLDQWAGSRTVHLFKCVKCNIKFEGWLKDGVDPRCFVCNPRTISSIQKQVIDWLSELSINYQVNDRKILGGLELDIVCGDVAFEINGCYWHSKHDKNYHAQKSKMAAERGIRLIHLFEDEIEQKPQIIKSRIAALFGKQEKVMARKTQVVQIKSVDARTFLNVTHWAGAGPGASVYYGLFEDKTLISVMSFGKPRWDKEYEWEILRFSSSKNVVGGASKLFSAFIKDKSPSSVMSYSERRWNWDDAVYRHLGFSMIKSTPIGYWYVGDKNKWTRESRMKFQKHKICTAENAHLDEEEIMKHNGYSRIYDCGNLKWGWNK